MLYRSPAEIADKATPERRLELCAAATKNGHEQGKYKARAYNHIRRDTHTHHLPRAHVSTLAKMPTSVVLMPIVQQTSRLNSSIR